MKGPSLVGLDLRRSTLWPNTGIARYGRSLLRSINAIPHEGLDIRAIDVKGSLRWPDSIGAGRGTPALRRALAEQTRMTVMTRRLQLLHLPWHEGPAHPLCPTVLTLFDLATIENTGSYPTGFRAYYNTLLRAHMRTASSVIVASRSTLDAARERWPNQRYHVIPLGVDPWFRSDEEKSATADPTILYTGGFDRRKRVFDLIEAVARLRSGVPSVRLVFCGRPRRELVELALCRLDGNVEFTGYLDDEELAAWYRRAWVVAYPTNMEGFGFPVVEAFASGTAVVATSVGSVPEIAQDAALLVAPGDVDALTDALWRLIDSDELRRSLRAAGLRRAQEFDWERVAYMTLDVYRQALA